MKTHRIELTTEEQGLIVAALAERAVAELLAGREPHAHAALDLAERVGEA